MFQLVSVLSKKNLIFLKVRTTRHCKIDSNWKLHECTSYNRKISYKVKTNQSEQVSSFAKSFVRSVTQNNNSGFLGTSYILTLAIDVFKVATNDGFPKKWGFPVCISYEMNMWSANLTSENWTEPDFHGTYFSHFYNWFSSTRLVTKNSSKHHVCFEICFVLSHIV